MVRVGFPCFIQILRNFLIVAIVVFLYFIYKERSLHRSKVAAKIPKNALKYIFFERVYHKQRNASQIKNIIEDHNQNVKMLNADTIGPIEKDTVVLVITVHRLSIYLEFLIVSLSQVKGIDEVLIIFSHTYYDQNVNTLIQSIDFCRVIQIFYPYSEQIIPDKFPNYSDGDCPYYISMKDAETAKCKGWQYPDIHGRFRNPKFTQHKHQWWWTANTVFELLLSTIGHKGLVVFLQDDLYIWPDFLYMITYMKQTAELLTRCEFLTIECIPFSYSCLKNTEGVEIKTWDPKYDYSVLAFDAATWNSIVAHYDLFCGIDDSSWVRSLFYVSMNRRDGPRYRIMSSVLPRAFKTSSCGFDGMLVNCDAIESVYQILDVQKRYIKKLFPQHLEIHINMETGEEFFCFDYAESIGGWSDPRDKELCSNFTTAKIRKVFLDMRNEFSSINLYQ